MCTWNVIWVCFIHINVRTAFIYTKPLVYNSVAICLVVTKLSHHPVQSTSNYCEKFQGWMRKNLLRYRRMRNTSLLSSLCACFSDAVVTWPNLIWMFNSYLQQELHKKTVWHAGQHKTMANFQSVAYVHNRCRSKYRCDCLFMNKWTQWDLHSLALSPCMVLISVKLC